MTGLWAGLLAAAAVLSRWFPGTSRYGAPGARPGGTVPGRWSGLLRAGTRTTEPDDLVEVLAQLAALVQAGLTVAQALDRVGQGGPAGPLRHLLVQAAAAHRQGLDVDAGLAGDERLADLAATLRLVARAGAPAGPTLTRLARAAAEEEEARLAVRSALAGPRATARVLAGLPLLGLLVAVVLGADPVGVLIGTGPGRVAGLVGAGCAAGGIVWTRALVRAAESVS